MAGWNCRSGPLAALDTLIDEQLVEHAATV
jgi:hypothetical protein